MALFRSATNADLPAIVRLLADDALGSTRERDELPLPSEYVTAFAAIQAQSGNEVIVAEEEGAVIGCLQFNMIPGLARLGMKRGQIEAVRLDRRYRGSGVGTELIGYAIKRARKEGCGLVQLTTDKSRGDAHRFYERLGFVASHEGMKLSL